MNYIVTHCAIKKLVGESLDRRSIKTAFVTRIIYSSMNLHNYALTSAKVSSPSNFVDLEIALPLHKIVAADCMRNI